MKKIFKLCFIVFTLFFTFCLFFNAFANNSVSASERKIYKFNVCFIRDLELDLLLNGELDKIAEDIYLDERNIILSKDETKILESNAYYYEYFTADTIKILGDKNNLSSFLSSKGLNDVKNYKIFYNSNVTDGYILHVTCTDETYIIPFLADYETKSPLTDRKVYTTEDFRNSINVEGTLLINGEKVECDVNPIFIIGNPYYPLRATLEKFGVEVVWDAKERSATFGNMKIYIDNPDGEIMSLNSDEEIWGHFIVVNDRILVQSWFSGDIEDSLGFFANYNLKEYTIEITQSKKEARMDEDVLKTIREFEPETLKSISEELKAKGWTCVEHKVGLGYTTLGMAERYSVIPRIEYGRNSTISILEATANGKYDDAAYVFVTVMFSKDTPKGEIANIVYCAADGRIWKPSTQAKPLEIVNASDVSF